MIKRKDWHVVVEAESVEELLADLVQVDKEKLAPLGGGNPILIRDGKFLAFFMDIAKAPVELTNPPGAPGDPDDVDLVMGGQDHLQPVEGHAKGMYAAGPEDASYA